MESNSSLSDIFGPTMYRVEVMGDTIEVRPFHDEEVAVFSEADAPSWVLDRVASLRMMNVPPPTHSVDGLGVRMSENVFWIIPPAEVSS